MPTIIKIVLIKFLIAGFSRSFFGYGQCQAGTAGDIIDTV